MTLSTRSKRWVWSGVAVVVMVAGAAGGLSWSRDGIRRAINRLNDSSAAALQSAATLAKQCVSAQRRQALSAELADLEARLRDLDSQARLVANLSETCRKHGDTVLEISPVATADKQAAPRRFRVVVGGTYRQLAGLLDGCATQRLPARVVEFTVQPPDQGTEPGRLRAEIIVECLSPPAEAKVNAT